MLLQAYNTNFDVKKSKRIIMRTTNDHFYVFRSVYFYSSYFKVHFPKMNVLLFSIINFESLYRSVLIIVYFRHSSTLCVDQYLGRHKYCCPIHATKETFFLIKYNPATRSAKFSQSIILEHNVIHSKKSLLENFFEDSLELLQMLVCELNIL